MIFPSHKTKIVCTIGPVSSGPDVLERMARAGMDVARLNLAHGDFDSHRMVVSNVRWAADAVGKKVAILADLPGPKMRVGRLKKEPLELDYGKRIVLFVGDVQEGADDNRIPVSFDGLSKAVRKGDKVYLNDGFIQLEVEGIDRGDVQCRVVVGGTLRSHKGINLPGIDLGVRAVTEYDLKCLAFAADEGIDAVSISFVRDETDIKYLRDAASTIGYDPFVIAKIERREALEHIDAILEAADGIMVARGDLGVEIPIEEVAAVQKRIIRKARLFCRPVITATQMLESMVENSRPTRAEVTDVANAILDGTDCVMLSEESAMGRYPVEAVSMMSRIAEVTENEPDFYNMALSISVSQVPGKETTSVEDIIAEGVYGAVRSLRPIAVVTPTASGATARRVARLRPSVWIAALSFDEKTCRRLVFSCGVYPVHVSEDVSSWGAYCRKWFLQMGVTKGLVVLTQGPSIWHPGGTNRMEIMDLERT
ncbi:MAG: pyruvate kinase [Dissulfurimicrobium sp.]|uniref:pyruvate kinase n=1 Tax=Dissulfurimicrobium sp. TaxID=2022436 RepID=UPI003D0E46A8